MHQNSDSVLWKVWFEEQKEDEDVTEPLAACRGIAKRTGVGKIRHLDTGSLWLQDAVKRKQIGILKVKGTENPSDLMTKVTDLATLDRLCNLMGLVVRSGRGSRGPVERLQTAPSCPGARRSSHCHICTPRRGSSHLLFACNREA